jgi:hypothetical protein
MNTLEVNYGYLLFNYVFIPKKIDQIPEINDTEFSLFSTLLYLDIKEGGGGMYKVIIKSIINRLILSNKFHIYENNNDTNIYLNTITNIKTDTTVHMKIDDSSNGLTDFFNEIDSLTIDEINKNKIKDKTIKRLLKDFNHNINNITNIIYTKIKNSIMLNDIDIKYAICGPLVFQYIDLTYNINRTFNKIAKIKTDTILSPLEKIKVVSKSEDEFVRYFPSYNKIINDQSVGGGNWRIFENYLMILDEFDSLDLKYIIVDSIEMIEILPPTIKKLYFYTRPLISENIKTSKSIKTYKYVKLYVNNLLNNFIEKSDLIINGNLYVDLDDKTILKEAFSKIGYVKASGVTTSIIPRSINIGKLSTLFTTDELTYINQNKDKILSINLIFEKLINYLETFCSKPENEFKNFIIKDAHGSRGAGVSGFKCNALYFENKTSVQNYLKLLFEIKRTDININKNVDKMLNTSILIQDFISSPSVKVKMPRDTKLYKFKVRLNILLVQDSNLTLRFFINRSFIFDFLPNYYTDTYLFEQPTSYDDAERVFGLYNSNIADTNTDIKKANKYGTYKSVVPLLRFNVNDKLRDFINLFARNFTDFITTNSLPIFINNSNKMPITKNISRVLAIDAIFDESDNYNIKMLEINTAGAIYDTEFEKHLTNFYAYGITSEFITHFIEADTVCHTSEKQIIRLCEYNKNEKILNSYYKQLVDLTKDNQKLLLSQKPNKHELICQNDKIIFNLKQEIINIKTKIKDTIMPKTSTKYLIHYD